MAAKRHRNCASPTDESHPAKRTKLNSDWCSTGGGGAADDSGSRGVDVVNVKRVAVKQQTFISHFFHRGCTGFDRHRKPATSLSPVVSSPPLQSKIVKFDDVADDLCVICCLGFDENPADVCLTLTSCQHTYHKGCIIRWKEENNSCPMCRTTISSI